jgi:hypothetical protein
MHNDRPDKNHVPALLHLRHDIIGIPGYSVSWPRLVLLAVRMLFLAHKN